MWKSGLLAGILFLPTLLPGQPAAGLINPPTLGFVFDSNARTLKPILGIPGASLFGPPLDTGLPLSYAATSPLQNYAILLAGDTSEVNFLSLLPAGSASVIPGARPAPDRIVFSPLGTAVVLYRANEALFQVITGLPGSPAVTNEIPALGLRGNLTSLAISDDAQRLLAAVSNNDTSQLIFFASDGIPRQLPVSGPIAGIAFRPKASDAVVVTSEHQVLLFSDFSGDPRVLGGPADGISQPVAVAFSTDGAEAFVANADTGNVVGLSLSGAPSTLIPCECTPTGLHRLAGNSIFRLNDLSAPTIKLLDGDAPTPRVVFVPSDSGAATSQRGDQ